MATSPCRTATSLSFTRRGDGNLTLSASQTSLSFTKERELRPHPALPLLQQGEGRFGGSQNRVRSSKSDNVEQS